MTAQVITFSRYFDDITRDEYLQFFDIAESNQLLLNAVNVATALAMGALSDDDRRCITEAMPIQISH